MIRAEEIGEDKKALLERDEVIDLRTVLQQCCCEWLFGRVC